MNRLLFSSIGFGYELNPIYEVAMLNPKLSEITLFYSDEEHPKSSDKIPVTENIENIREYFRKSKIKVLHQGFEMATFEENSYEMAAYIIGKMKEFPDHNIILDLSAGRVPIKQSLARAGEIVYNYYKTRKVNVEIICAMRPQDSDYVSYIIGNYDIPNDSDADLLHYIAVEGYKSQKLMADKLGWNNQSEISKSLQRLRDLGLLDASKKYLTEKGHYVNSMFSQI